MFQRRGWTPFDFQRRAWEAYLAGRSGLIHAPTGMGKTLAVWLGPVAEALHDAGPESAKVRVPARARNKRDTTEPLRVLWITPLRALAADTTQALIEPLAELGLNWSVETRTGDTPQSLKRKQRDRLPTALVTTPESLSLLLSYPDARERLATLRCVVIDEWHELLGTKRGVQTELALTRLREFHPAPRALRTWGLSATIGNLEQAARVLVGVGGADGGAAPEPALIKGVEPKTVIVESIIPDDIERFPWAGHLGIKVLGAVIDAVEKCSDAPGGGGTTLIFCNVRSQAEIWFRRILDARPDWLGEVAIHHGSLERSLRGRVEDMLRAGRKKNAAPEVAGSKTGGAGGLRCVVCTSSLDLGVDFAPVEQVIQIGSPRGVARLLQRAGRSGHRPGAASRVLCAPTNALELVEFAAARTAAARKSIEQRVPLRKALDVLIQHLVTLGAGGGFREDEMYDVVRTSHAFSDLTRQEWSWALDFVRGGGPALGAYDRYARVRPDAEGVWRIASEGAARTHRLGIGTITSDPMLHVTYAGSGRTIGSIEESFISRLRNGDRFVFAGRVLELVRLRDMTAYVKRATKKSGAVPKWNGGRMQLSSELAAAVLERFEAAERAVYDGPEMGAVRPILDLQARWSRLPTRSRLVIERIDSRDGHHAFIFLFAGRACHEGLGPLLAYRLSRLHPATITSTANDYGVELLSSAPITLDVPGWRELLSEDRLLDDLLECLNASQLARRQFRDIARVAGLIVPNYPGQRTPARQLQASSDMFYDVLSEFDPANLLLDQARREVLDAQLEVRRLRTALAAARDRTVDIVKMDRLSPLGFGLWAERLRATTLSSQTWHERLESMVVRLEAEAGDED
jgi:ATP-dependent Lhr-like helicase